MAVYLTTDEELASVASAIRVKGGTSASLAYPTEFISAISAINTGTDTSDATLSSGDQMLSNYTAYAEGVKYTGTIVSWSTSGNTTLNAVNSSQIFAAGYYPNAHGVVVTVYDGSVT